MRNNEFDDDAGANSVIFEIQHDTETHIPDMYTRCYSLGNDRHAWNALSSPTSQARRKESFVNLWVDR